MSHWKNFVKYFNEIPLRDFLIRKEARDATGIPANTFDSYRRILQVNNIIGYASNGLYIKCHNIPSDISLTELRIRGYGQKDRYIPEVVYDEHGGRFDVNYRIIKAVAANPLYKSKGSILDL